MSTTVGVSYILDKLTSTELSSLLIFKNRLIPPFNKFDSLWLIWGATRLAGGQVYCLFIAHLHNYQWHFR